MLTPEKQKVLELYNAGLEAYKKRQWDVALQYFEQALHIDPNDGPSKVYVERCKQFKLTPPPDDWDGVYTMTTK